VSGGRSKTELTITSCETFDLTSKQWTMMKNMKYRRKYHGMAAMDGTVKKSCLQLYITNVTKPRARSGPQSKFIHTAAVLCHNELKHSQLQKCGNTHVTTTYFNKNETNALFTCSN